MKVFEESIDLLSHVKLSKAKFVQGVRKIKVH